MTDDLIQRLQARVLRWGPWSRCSTEDIELIREAADEITRLRARTEAPADVVALAKRIAVERRDALHPGVQRAAGGYVYDSVLTGVCDALAQAEPAADADRTRWHAHLDALADRIEQREAVAAEREACAAWLRAKALELYATGAPTDQYQADGIDECADAIERGDHIRARAS